MNSDNKNYRHDRYTEDGADRKPRKFFGFEVSDTITYLIVIVLAIVFVRQVSLLF